MKILITSTENNLSALIDKRFGRAHWFCVFDQELNETTFIENPNIEAQGGAGSKSAENIIGLGVEKVISGHFGPKAKTVLDKFNIQMIEIDEETTIEKLIEKLK